MSGAIMHTARGPMRLVEKDWAAMTDAERVRHFEVEGYVVLPKILDTDHIRRLKEELDDLPMATAPYSEEQRYSIKPPQWHSNTACETIAHPPLTDFIHQLMGDDVIFMLGFYITSGAGVPGLTLHSDYQPHGSEQKGWEESSPATARCLIYLDDLTPERAPFTILPRSHLSMHSANNPYLRYDDHPDQVTICLEAGSAIVFNIRALHGTHPNLSDFRRAMLELAYRPGWAKTAGEVKEWDPEDVARAPEQVKRYLRSRNAGPLEDHPYGTVFPGSSVGKVLSGERHPDYQP